MTNQTTDQAVRRPGGHRQFGSGRSRKAASTASSAPTEPEKPLCSTASPGFYKPEIGEIDLMGHPLVGLLPDQIVRLGIARTYQNIRLFPALTAMENILVGLHTHLKARFLGIVMGTPGTRKEEKKEAKKAAETAAVRQPGRQRGSAGQESALRRPAAPGNRPRPGHTPKVLLLDEPAAGMNPKRIPGDDGLYPAPAG